MRREEIRRFLASAALVAGAFVAGGAIPAAAGAQVTDTAVVNRPVDTDDDDGMDLGWIGLLGLAGLLGLRRRETHHVVDRPVDTTTTRRP